MINSTPIEFILLVVPSLPKNPKLAAKYGGYVMREFFELDGVSKKGKVPILSSAISSEQYQAILPKCSCAIIYLDFGYTKSIMHMKEYLTIYKIDMYPKFIERDNYATLLTTQ